MIHTLQRLPTDQMSHAGGKGRTLARLAQAGYPVPAGIVIPPQAFRGDELTEAAWEQALAQLAVLRAQAGGGQKDRTAFAVRSSALSEDSAQASFAGELETVLDVSADADLHRAIAAVRRSRHSARVQAYSQAQAIAPEQELAVVVQRLVRAELAGVLFTADPITGSRAAIAAAETPPSA